MSKRRETNARKRQNFDNRMDDGLSRIRRLHDSIKSEPLRLQCDCCTRYLKGFTNAQLEGKLSAKYQGYPITCSKKCKKELKKRG